MTEATTGSRVRVALVNDYEIVVSGLRRMLAPYENRIEIVELDVNTDVERQVDVALYDTFSASQVDGGEVDELLSDGDVGSVAVYTWNMQQELIEAARSKGVRGYLSKSLDGAALAEAIERVHAGERAGEMVVAPISDIGHEENVRAGHGDWPGRREGLSARQAEVVALICQGYSNEEIARRAYLSVNTVKSYIRVAYRTMGVESRSQAVLWGLDHGLAADRKRAVSVGR